MSLGNVLSAASQDKMIPYNRGSSNLWPLRIIFWQQTAVTCDVHV